MSLFPSIELETSTQRQRHSREIVTSHHDTRFASDNRPNGALIIRQTTARWDALPTSSSNDSDVLSNKPNHDHVIILRCVRDGSWCDTHSQVSFARNYTQDWLS
jgi:hypothetical protein